MTKNVKSVPEQKCSNKKIYVKYCIQKLKIWNMYLCKKIFIIIHWLH